MNTCLWRKEGNLYEGYSYTTGTKFKIKREDWVARMLKEYGPGFFCIQAKAGLYQEWPEWLYKLLPEEARPRFSVAYIEGMVKRS